MSDGKLVTLEEFIHLMRNYETCFRDDEVPLLKSLFLVILILTKLYPRIVEIVVVTKCNHSVRLQLRYITHPPLKKQNKCTKLC
jgi:hypothetical protein